MSLKIFKLMIILCLKLFMNGFSIEFSDSAPSKNGKLIDEELDNHLTEMKYQVNLKDLINRPQIPSLFQSKVSTFTRSESVSPPIFILSEKLSIKNGNTNQ